MTAKCTSGIHFRMHIYAISTWLIILGCTITPCTACVHVHSEMPATGTFGSHGMGGGDATASVHTFGLESVFRRGSRLAQ